MTVVFVVLAIVAFLAGANGANDVSKGIATLVGSGLTSYSRALAWGTVWTAAGAGVATVTTAAMLSTFGGGLLTVGVSPTLGVAASAIAGAALWVVAATYWRLPVSTTHAIVGAVVGSAVVGYGVSGVAWSSLVGRVALPLSLSPLVAVALGFVLSAFFNDLHGGATNAAHWLSSAAVSFARGLNDAPKIVALGLGAAAVIPAEGPHIPDLGWFLVVGLSIVVGSLAAGRRVTRVLAEDITPMTHHNGLTANAVAASLVAAGAVYGWPMSTTHVATGGIVGVGARRGEVVWPTVFALGSAWVITLPAAAALAAGCYQFALASGLR